MSQDSSDVFLRDLNAIVIDKRRELPRIKRGAFRDAASVFELALRGEFQSASNYLFTKLWIPVGEGSKGYLFKYFHTLDKIRKDPENVPLPEIFEMETTTVCNKKCRICEYIYWKPEEQVKRHLSLDEFKHVVDQFPRVRWVNLTGEGSSFLNKDYPDMLKYLWEKHRSSIWLVDHLTDVTPDFLTEKVFPYVHGIYVSMDAATKNTYEAIKQGCSFDNVINNLKGIISYKKAQRTNFPHISFRYVILTETVEEIPLFLDMVNSLGTPDDWGGSSSTVEFAGLLTFPEIQKYYVGKIPKQIIDDLRERRQGIRFYFSHAEEDRNPPIDCCPAWVEPYIMLPGYVVPCCAVMMSNNRPFLRKYSFGNVFEKTITEIWNNEYYRQFRKLINDPGAPVPRVCVGCRAFQTRQRVARHGIWDHLKG